MPSDEQKSPQFRRSDLSPVKGQTRESFAMILMVILLLVDAFFLFAWFTDPDNEARKVAVIAVMLLLPVFVALRALASSLAAKAQVTRLQALYISLTQDLDLPAEPVLPDVSPLPEESAPDALPSAASPDSAPVPQPVPDTAPASQPVPESAAAAVPESAPSQQAAPPLDSAPVSAASAPDDVLPPHLLADVDADAVTPVPASSTVPAPVSPVVPRPVPRPPRGLAPNARAAVSPRPAAVPTPQPTPRPAPAPKPGPRPQPKPRDPRSSLRTDSHAPQSGSQATQRVTRPQREHADGHMFRGVWVPPLPQGTPMDPWARGNWVEVSDEVSHPQAFIALLGDREDFYEDRGAFLQTTAVLVTDPKNPNSQRHAVAVFVDGHHVGHLSTGDSRRYFPRLKQIEAIGRHLRVPATVSAHEVDSRVSARVAVRVPAPGALLPSNDLPREPHVTLPAGESRHVKTDDEFMPELRAHASGESVDGRTYVAAVLATDTKSRRQTVEDVIWVTIDGQIVGRVRREQVRDLWDAVRRVERSGYVPVVRASVRPYGLAQAAMELDLASPQDLSAWLDKELARRR